MPINDAYALCTLENQEKGLQLICKFTSITLSSYNPRLSSANASKDPIFIKFPI